MSADKSQRALKSQTDDTQILPWLIYTHGNAKSKKVQTFSTMPFNNKSYLKSIPEMRGKYIHAAQLGWLFLRDKQPEDPDSYSITLWNPFTLKLINLPPLIYHDLGPAPMTCGLTSPPTDEDDDNNTSCFVFLFFQGRAFSYQYRPGDLGNTWVSTSIELQGETARILTAVTLNGIIYGLALSMIDLSKRSLLRIDIADDGSNSFTFSPLPISLPPKTFSNILMQCFNFMIESCGSIYIIQIGTGHYDGAHAVNILELDMEKGIWVEVKCLGDRSFLLADRGSTWCCASESVQRNCVYFFRAEFVREAVVRYSLNDSSSTFLACPKLLNPRHFPVWVMPHYKRLPGRRGCEERIETVVDDQKLTHLKIMHLLELPLHIIQQISEHMHLFDYWNFRRTSKLINSETPVPQWRTSNLLPLLMVFEDDSGFCRLMDPCRDDTHSCNLPFSLDHFDIKFCKNGWLLIFDAKSLLFFNPFTKEKGYMPPVLRCCNTIGFSTFPTCSECVTVSIHSWTGQIIIKYLKSGSTYWRTCEFDNTQGFVFNPGFGSPVYYEGAFYFLDEDAGYLGVFELVDRDTRWTVYDRPFVRVGKLHSCHLVECSGELLSVFIGNNGNWIQVFKLNKTKKKWVRVKDLGNHVLFISHVSCFSVVTRDSKMRNRLYFPWLIGKHTVYYSLDNGKYYANDFEHTTTGFFSMRQPSRCCWV